MRRLPAVLLPSLLWFGCGGPAPLTVEMPLHLEEHVSSATIAGSAVPANPPQPVEWRFDQPQPDWKATPQWPRTIAAAALARTSEGLRVTLTEGSDTRSLVPNGTLLAGIHVDLPDWDRADWADVVIRARADSASSVAGVGLRFNLRDGRPTTGDFQSPYQFAGQNSPIVRDGSIQTYRLRVDWSSTSSAARRAGIAWQGPWRQLALWFWTDGTPGSIDILSVTVVPKGAQYADVPHGVRPVTVGDRTRRTLFTHAPGRFSYRVRVPEGGRLDTGLGVLGDDAPVTFRVAVQAGGREEILFEEVHADPEEWAPRSVDLSRYAGQSVALALETRVERPGTVALWGAPTVSGHRSSELPNVIFYVIDGGGADQMSLYGYNRGTTPNLERLAEEGVVFEYAYSNSDWTKPSTASFMTSLHASVLGFTGDRRDAVPEQAVTMAERFHRAGYQTAVFTTNPNAGSVSGLERGVDVFRDEGVPLEAASSVELHANFWDWREASPGEPYWVHFQTTDVHSPHQPLAPFAGLFFSPADERDQGAETSNGQRSLFDETMAHQDYQLGRLVARLREAGQWRHTLLIIAADHSIWAGSDDFLVPLSDSLPEGWERTMLRQNPILRSSMSRVPLLFIWPGRIAGGQRFRDPVSMIDVLPTVLELAGLPEPEVLQGRSLAPLLLGQGGGEPRPVIFDQFATDSRTGELQGRIEMIDGRWGASLWIGPPRDSLNPRPTPLLLFDVWNDPLALTPMNDAYPELVTKYTALLERQWEAHRLLATRFTPGGTVELTPAQLEALRALGYIR